MFRNKFLLTITTFAIISVFLNYKFYKRSEYYKLQAVNLSQEFNDYQKSQLPMPKHNGIVMSDVNGIDVLLMNDDEVISSTIYNNKEWEPHLQNALKQLIKPKDKVLVIGAHIGIHALLISKLVGDDGKVSIFEPNPNTLRFLKANLAINSVVNATLYPKAAFSKNTTIPFVAVTKGNTGISRIAREDDKENQDVINVEAVTIDSVKEIKTIDILQMDAEGVEPEVVYGAVKLIDNSPNLIVFQEWSPFWIKDIDAYLKFWRSRGFKFAHIELNGLKELTDEELKNSPEQLDILITKNLEEIIRNYKY